MQRKMIIAPIAKKLGLGRKKSLPKKRNMPTLGFLIAWATGNLDKYNG